MKDEIKNEPSFIDQAFAIIEANYNQDTDQNKHGMTIADHKLLCKVLDVHEKYIDDKVVPAFVSQISEYHKPIMEQLKRLDDIVRDIALIKNDMLEMKQRQSTEEFRLGQIEAWQERKKRRIEVLEEIVQPNLLNEFKEEIKEIKPYLITTGRFLKWWKWWRIVIAIIVFIALIFGLIWVSHKVELVTQVKDKPKVGQTYEELLMNYSPSVRGQHYDPFTKDTVR